MPFRQLGTADTFSFIAIAHKLPSTISKKHPTNAFRLAVAQWSPYHCIFWVPNCWGYTLKTRTIETAIQTCKHVKTMLGGFHKFQINNNALRPEEDDLILGLAHTGSRALGLGYCFRKAGQAYAGCLALSSMSSMATAIRTSTMRRRGPRMAPPSHLEGVGITVCLGVTLGYVVPKSWANIFLSLPPVVWQVAAQIFAC